ncbi:MAG TPA: RidA family protein [Oscillospiraceae bacterium]|nr:RidA family protein [Oscillospiraceae bacterium]HNW04154.1 RidA family protein [Oscillospiraceae bacterium]
MGSVVHTEKAPAAIGPYSQGIKAGKIIFTSGQLPADPETGSLASGAAEQAKRSLQNVRAVLEAAGAGMEDVVKTTVFLRNMDDFAAVNAVYADFFPSGYPARSAVEVARLPKDALVEIEAVAVVE